MGDQRIAESQVRSSVKDVPASLPPSLPERQGTRWETGGHIAHIFRALQQLQPRVSAPPASSAYLPNSLTFEDGAAAWMCSRLDLLWESMATSVTTRPSAQANAATAAAMPTHPRTQLVLQLLALEALRRERRRGAFVTNSLSPSSASTAASVLRVPSGVGNDVSASTACRSLRLVPACCDDTRFETRGLPVVHQWLWQRAAALPSVLTVATSSYGDLSALMTEWATLALPAWLESSEETRWRHERDEARRLAHEITVAAVARSWISPGEEAREVGELAVTVPDLGQQSTAGTGDSVFANGVGSLNSSEVVSMPQVRAAKEEAVTAASLPEPLLMPTANGASPSPPRRLLKLGVPATVNPTTARLVDAVATADADAVARLPGRLTESEEEQGKKSVEEPTKASSIVSALTTTSLPQHRAVDTPALSSANGVGTGDRDVSGKKRLTIQLFHSGGTAAPVSTETSRGTAVGELEARVATRPPMLISDEDATDEDAKARGPIVETSDSTHDAIASAPPTSEAGENAGACMRSRLRRWRRLAPIVLDAPPCSEAAQNACTVLESLGFATADEGGFVDNSLMELTSSCCSRVSSDELLKQSKTPASPRSEEREACEPKPRCPLGRLPPLFAAHAWLTNASLRSSWIAHIVTMPTSERSLARGDDGSEPCLEETAPVSRVFQAALPPVPAPSPSLSAFCCSDSSPPPLPAASLALPCIALADHRVFEMLDELLWCAYPSTTAFLISFEENLHGYLCYPLAGVRAAAATGRALRQAPPQLEQKKVVVGCRATSAPFSLTMSVWKAYLGLRYGKTHLRQPSDPHPSPSRMADATKAAAAISGAVQNVEPNVAAAAAARARAGGPYSSETRKTRARLSVDEAAPQPAMPSVTASAAKRGCTPLAPFAAAAVSASSSAAASATVYAAVMDMAAMVFLSELRRLGAVAMTEKAMCAMNVLREGHVCCGAGPLQTSAQQRAGASGSNAESGVQVESPDDGEGMRQWASAAVGTANASCFKDAEGVCDDSVSSLQALLEGTIESDAALHRYAGRRLAPLSLLPDTSTSVLESQRNGGGEKTSLAAAARLWLGLVTVLSLGESATAQYVRGVLIPPLRLPAVPFFHSPASAAGVEAAAEAIGASSLAARTSLAPFTMPTLFRSTLEDLYYEESAAIAAAAAVADSDDSPPPQPSSLPLCAPVSLKQEEDAATGATAKCRVFSASMSAATLATQDTLVLSAAVALRHPRVILRQLHFLWQLSYCENHDANVTGAGGASLQSGTLKSPMPAPPHTGSTAANSPRAVGAVDHRATAKSASENRAPSCKEEFTTRIASLVECVQLASLAGLPPPVASSLTPARPCSSVVPAEGADSALRRGASAASTRECSTAIGTSAAAAIPLQQQCGTAAFPPLLPAPGTDTASTVTTPATATRLRLQLSSKPSFSSFVRAAVGGSEDKRRDGVKRSRELHETAEADVGVTEPALPSSADDVAVRIWRPAKSHRTDGVATRSLLLKPPSCTRAPPPPPPLESLAEVHVRWADEVQGDSVSTRLASTPSATTSFFGAASGGEAATSRSALLLSAVADTLWDVLQDIHAQMPGTALSSARVSCGDGPAPVSDPSAATFAASAILARGDETKPEGTPARRTPLRLCVSPAYRGLRRLWQAIGFPNIPERGVMASSETSAPSCTGGGAGGHARLDVVLPATASSDLAPAVDLRLYNTLTASLRGVVCVVLGYAVYEGLHAICCRWCVRCNAHKGVAIAAGRTGSLPASVSQRPRTPFLTSCASYAWLAGQLRALHESVLQPLNRVLKVPVPAMGDTNPVRDFGESDVARGDRHLPAAHISSPLRPPSAGHVESLATAAWLSYSPLGLVLLPTLIRQLEASIYRCPAGNCVVTSGGPHCLDAHEAWAQVKVALQRAGAKV